MHRYFLFLKKILPVLPCLIAAGISPADAQADREQCAARNAPALEQISRLNEAWQPLYRTMLAGSGNAFQLLSSQMETIRQHERALQAQYTAEQALFAAIAPFYNIPDTAYLKIRDRLQQLDGSARQKAYNCLRAAHPEADSIHHRTAEQFLREWREKPDAFGYFRAGTGTARLDTAVITAFLTADSAAESTVFSRLKAEKALQEWLTSTQEGLQDLWQQIPVLTLVDKAPSCFDKTAIPSASRAAVFNPQAVTALTTILRRPVQYDTTMASVAATCMAGVENPSLLKRLPAWKQSLQQQEQKGIPEHPVINEWLKEADRVRAMEVVLQGQQLAIEELQEQIASGALQGGALQQAQENLQKQQQQYQQYNERFKTAQVQLERRIPAAVSAWEQVRKRRMTLEDVMREYPVDRLAPPEELSNAAIIRGMKTLGRQLNLTFVSEPDNPAYRVSDATTPFVLQAMKNFSLYQQQRIERFLQVLSKNPSLLWAQENRQAICGLRQVMVRQLQQLDPSCLGAAEQNAAMDLLNTLKTK